VPQVEVVAQVAPLVGILGTVWGMIIAFGGMALGLAAGVGLDGERLTEGISRALVTTGAGLAVAIPATIIHHALRARIDRFTEDLEQTIRDLILTLASAETTRRKAARQRTGADATTPVPSSPPRTAAR